MKQHLLFPIKNNSLKLKIILFSVLLTILPVLIVGIISYNKAYSIIVKTTIENTRQLTDQIAKSTELSFYEIEKFLSIRKNASTIRFLLSDTKEERNQYAFQILEMINMYKNNYRFSTSVDDILIIGMNQYDFSERYGVFSYSEDKKKAYIDRFGKSNGAMVVSLQSGTTADTELYVLIGAPVYQVSTNDVIGVVVVKMNTDPFTSFTENYHLGNNGFYFFRDQFGILFNENGVMPENTLSTDQELKISNDDYGYSISEISGVKELIFYSTINNYQWKVIGKVRVNDIMSEMLGIKQYYYYLIILCIIASALLNIWVIRWLFIPLDKLKQKMSIVANGNLNVALTHYTSDEIAQLNDAFNNMMAQIRDLMQGIRKEQETLRKTQLQVLQAQINPHFLYNTLDTIIWLIYAHDNEKAIETVESLSNFFRTVLSNGKDFIPVKDEIEHVRNYLAIQKSRDGNMLNFEIEVNDNIMDFIMMKLILQPIVENAVYHGLKFKGGGKIWINGWLDGEDIIFTVRDNGVGMDDEKINSLVRVLNDNEIVPSEHGYGLYNVQKRIRLYYSGNYGLTIASKKNEGTIVTVRIKREKDE